MRPSVALDVPSTRAADVPSVTADTTTHELGEAIATLAAQLHAATYQLLVMLREFDARRGWNNGFLSCAHWLHWRTGIDLGACREKVRVARALAALPVTSATMEAGQVSYAKVRAITRVATADTERRLVNVALAGTAAHVERVVRAWRRVDRVAERKETSTRHLNRSLSTWVDDDGMVVIRGRLTPEVGAIVQRALEAASDVLFREGASLTSISLEEEVTSAQRRADALGRVAEVALSAALDRGSAGDRYQVVVHVEREVHLGQVQELDGVVETDSGPIHVSAETSRRLACDAAVVEIGHDAKGTALDVGRRTRTIPPAIRRALDARDRHCRFPGCTSKRCDAHHIEHWMDGGRTSLSNLVLLCRRHHRAVHEGQFALVSGLDGVVAVVRSNGEALASSPTLSRVALQKIAEAPAAAPPTWDGTPLDLEWAIDVLYQPRRT